MKICHACQESYPDELLICPKDHSHLYPAMEIPAGTVIRGKYEILEKLGEGGMGAVFKVKHVHFGDVSALKLVADRLLQEPGFLQRFRAEAMLMRKLNHPNAVSVHDYDETEDGHPFMVMDYVEGTHLDKLVEGGKQLDIERAVKLIMQVCDALGVAHKLGIIHRDIKPANILVAKGADGTEVVKLLDFGVAKVKEQSQLIQAAKTAAGIMIGTPAYMSPEQVKGIPSDQLDGRVDLYAVGVVLFELLTGRAPFVEKKPVLLLMAHAANPPPDPRSLRKDLSAALAGVVLKALEKKPEDRFANAEEMRNALAAALAAGEAAPVTTTAPAVAAAVGAPPPVPPPAPPGAAAPPARIPAAPIATAAAAALPGAPGQALGLGSEATAQQAPSRFAGNTEVAPPAAAPAEPPATPAAKPAGPKLVQRARPVDTYRYRRRRAWSIVIAVLLLAALAAAIWWLWARMHPAARGGQRTRNSPAPARSAACSVMASNASRAALPPAVRFDAARLS